MAIFNGGSTDNTRIAGKIPGGFGPAGGTNSPVPRASIDCNAAEMRSSPVADRRSMVVVMSNTSRFLLFLVGGFVTLATLGGLACAKVRSSTPPTSGTAGTGGPGGGAQMSGAGGAGGSGGLIVSGARRHGRDGASAADRLPDRSHFCGPHDPDECARFVRHARPAGTAPCITSPAPSTLMPRNWLRPRFDYLPPAAKTCSKSR